MIKLFQNIRKQLLNEGKTTKYFKYAIGEIVLVVIGILIALQINNWNEKKKEEEKTKLLIEQVYSAIKRDNDKLNSNIIFYNDQLKDHDILFKRSDSLSDHQLLEMLFYVETTPIYSFEADTFSNELNFESVAKNNIYLVAQIKNFLNGNEYKKILVRGKLREETILPVLLKNGISEITLAFGYGSFFEFNQFNGWFDEQELKTTRQLFNSGILKNPIKSSMQKKFGYLKVSKNIIEDGNYLMAEIKKEFPSIRLMYDNVGIIGSSLPTGYDKSVPMKLIDEYESIWEIDIELSEGTVKFRTRDSWTQDWGGKSFPKGYAQSFGQDIYISRSGRYHVEINLNKNSYEFKKLN